MDAYFGRLASSEPVPGGGSAAMVCGSLACALVAMVARICKDQDLAQDADRLRGRMEEQRVADEAAFAAVVQARGDKTMMQSALKHAAEVPLESAALCLQALQLTQRALALENAHLISDIGCANAFAFAALRGSAFNVRVNHKYMKDAQIIARQKVRLDDIEAEGTNLWSTMSHAVSSKLA